MTIPVRVSAAMTALAPSSTNAITLVGAQQTMLSTNANTLSAASILDSSSMVSSPVVMTASHSQPLPTLVPTPQQIVCLNLLKVHQQFCFISIFDVDNDKQGYENSVFAHSK